MARNATPRRGASRSQPRQRQIPGWVWLFTGVAAGVFIAFLFHLGQVQMDAERSSREARQTAASDEGTASKDEDARGPRFDFYAVLPQMEVIMPKGEEDTPQPARPGRDTAPADTGSDSDVAHRHSERFLLQAGSFRRSEDADRRRAELILQGLEARVQPVSLESGDTWHRVMIGPFGNANAMHRVQDQLVGAGIETLAIRVRDPDA